MQLEIHPTQAEILMFLLFRQEAPFSELNVTGLETDHLNFHVQRLVSLGFIEKNENKRYSLTAKGKEFSNRFDTNSAQVERQAKVGVLVVVIKQDKSKTRYLLQERLKHPYYGYYGFVTGKMKWGETVKEAAERELLEETGLQAECSLVGIKHKMDYDPTGKILEDKFFFVIKAENSAGTLIKNFEGGRNLWLTLEEALDTELLFPGVAQSIEMVSGKTLQFSEDKYTVEKY